MRILVINAGSSSLKYQLIDMNTETCLASGNCERIGVDGFISHKTNDGRTYEKESSFLTHKEAFAKLEEVLTSSEVGVINSMSEIKAVGHRVVHGGEHFTDSVIIDDAVLTVIKNLSNLAPLHNPAAVIAIKACKASMPSDILHIAVFDTSFHQTMPEKAFVYAIPYKYYQDDGIRRYGFHGTSHRYVSALCAKELGRPIEELKIITCHLGNGSSIAAVDRGRCIDTSMGFTPLAGLVMGTRSGDIDPSIITYLMEKHNYSAQEVSDVLHLESGFLGLSGISSDNRDVQAAADEGNHRAKLAGSVMQYGVKKYIGSYIAAMGGVDAIVFTGGIGENAKEVREAVCEDMSFLGIEIDTVKNNELSGRLADISKEKARVRTFIIPTNEELLIARDTLMLIK